jgi:ribokinase
MNNILVLGSINIDFVIFTERFPKPGETIKGNDFGIFQGGKGANQAIALAKLGCPTLMLGKTGDDELKNFALKSLKKFNVNTNFITTSRKISTGSASIWVNQAGDNSIIIFPGANARVDVGYINKKEALFQKNHWFLSQFEVPLSSIMQALKFAKKYRMNTVIDPAPVIKIYDSNFWGKVDYLLPNEIELKNLTGEDDLLPAIKSLKSKGVREVIVKMGEKGAGYERNNHLYVIPGSQVKNVVDTTGAGDCFAAGFIKGMIEYQNIEKAIKVANLVASYSTQKKGAAISFPTIDEICWDKLQ